MKIAATVCEYNPLHNGHIKHIRFIKENLKPDVIIVFMSGNFVQRGEGAVADKYTRAVWGIKAGADLVIELPTPFALGGAEVFASGAVKLMKDMSEPMVFCFGAENGDKEAFLNNAKIFLSESKELKSAIKERLNLGYSPVKARYEGVKAINPEGFDKNLFENPNNILGIEYTKAILRLKANIDILPMKREGSHTDDTLYKEETSASSIRKAIDEKVKKSKIKRVVPDYVYKTLPQELPDFSLGLMTEILLSPAEKIKKSPDCTEGLENRIKYLALENPDYKTAVKKITTKRYTESRIKRITVCNMLGITENLVEDALEDSLYFKVLAANSTGLEFIGENKKKSKIPYLTRKTEYAELTGTAKAVFEKDALASNIYSLFTGRKVNEFATEILTDK